MKNSFYLAVCAALSFFLASCGGGGFSGHGAASTSNGSGAPCMTTQGVLTVSTCGVGGSPAPAPLASSVPVPLASSVPVSVASSCQAAVLPSSAPVQSHLLQQLKAAAPGFRVKLASSPSGKGSNVPMVDGGGPVIPCANVVVLCLNAPCTNFGIDDNHVNHNESPCDFWNRLDNSPMIHITDEYVHQTANNRYVCTTSTEVDGVPTGALSDQQMVNIISSHLSGTGFTTIYNLFMSPAQIGTGPGECAYHTWGTVNASGQSNEVVYTAISTCWPEDSMNHEMFEAITQPQADGSGWSTLGNNTSEISDLCENLENPTVLGGVTYVLQPLWSNAQNACVYAGP